MKNFIQPGHSLPLTAPAGGVTSGEAVLIGALVVIPSVDADEGKTFAAHIGGVYSVTKTTGEAWTEGAILYFDDSTGAFTTTASGNYKAGVASETAASGDTEGAIRLDGTATTAEA